MPITDRELILQFEKVYDKPNTIKCKVNDIRQLLKFFNPENLTELININVDDLTKFITEKYTKNTTRSSIVNSLFTLKKIIVGEEKSQDLYKLAKTKWEDKDIDQIRGITKSNLPMSLNEFVKKMTAFINDKNNDAYLRLIVALAYFLPLRLGEEFKDAIFVSNEDFNKLKNEARYGLFNIDNLQYYRYTSKNKDVINVDFDFPEVRSAIKDGALQGRDRVFTQTTPEGINYFIKNLMKKVIGIKIGSQKLRQFYATRRETEYLTTEEFKKDARQMGHSPQVHSLYVNRLKLDKMSDTSKQLYIESRDLINDILFSLNNNQKVKEFKDFNKMLKECHKNLVC